jgi:hypothetical protein
MFGTAEDAWRIVGLQGAFLAELVGTALLALLVSAVTHARNRARPAAGTEALLIGVCVAAIISIVAPLTQAGLNPARDFGPRLVAWFLGWGEIAIPGPRGGWFTVSILAPVIGALIGGGAYRLVAKHLLPSVNTDPAKEVKAAFLPLSKRMSIMHLVLVWHVKCGRRPGATIIYASLLFSDERIVTKVI